MAVVRVTEHFGTRGSTVQVDLQAGGAATLYSDAAGTVPLTNPITVGPNGAIDFFVAPGSYVLTESGNGTDRRALAVGLRSSFSPDQLLELGGTGSEIASMPFSVSTVATVTDTAVTGWQIVVPANSGPITVKISNMLWSLITGTLASGTQQYAGIGIKDEAGVVVAYAKWQVIATGVTTTQVNTLTVEGDLPNNVATKTYSVWIKCPHVDLGSSATFFTSGSGFVDPVLKALRR